MRDKYIISAIIAGLTITGCGSEDEGSSHHEAFSGGWGVPEGTSFQEIKAQINAIDPVIAKADANNGDGRYIRRSNNFNSVCTGNTAYWSEHFELGVETDAVDIVNIQRLAGIAEVALEQIAAELEVNPESLIRHTYGSTTADGRKRLGFCIKEGVGSTAGGHGSEITGNEQHTYGGEYEFGLMKHELGHVIDGQLKNNEFSYNLGPLAWFIEGLAEHVSGSGAYNLTEWQKMHQQLSPNTNIVKNDGTLAGGYESYHLYATMTYYLQEQGLGDEAFIQFVKSDRWHRDGEAFDICEPYTEQGYGMTTGTCNMPMSAKQVWIERFEDAIALGTGELTSYQQFEDDYYELINTWLGSK